MSALYEALTKYNMPENRCVAEDDCDYFDEATENYIHTYIFGSLSEEDEVNFDAGATQFCFIDHKNKVAYKIPFTHYLSYENEEVWDEEEERYVWDYAEEPTEIPLFQNYTAYAEVVYEDAIDFNVEMFFAEVKVAGYSANGLPFWEQPLCIPYQSHKSTPTKDSLERVEKLNEIMHNPFRNDWAAECIDVYGEDAWVAFLDFLDQYDVRDLHSGNYGWEAETGRPIVFDYSGYCE